MNILNFLVLSFFTLSLKNTTNIHQNFINMYKFPLSSYWCITKRHSDKIHFAAVRLNIWKRSRDMNHFAKKAIAECSSLTLKNVVWIWLHQPPTINTACVCILTFSESSDFVCRWKAGRHSVSLPSSMQDFMQRSAAVYLANTPELAVTAFWTRAEGIKGISDVSWWDSQRIMMQPTSNLLKIHWLGLKVEFVVGTWTVQIVPIITKCVSELWPFQF